MALAFFFVCNRNFGIKSLTFTAFFVMLNVVCGAPEPQSPYQVDHFHRDFGSRDAPSNDADRQSAASTQRRQCSPDQSSNDYRTSQQAGPSVSLYGEGQQQQRCHDLVSRKLGGYNRQTFRAAYVRGDIEETQRGIFLCCVKQYLDPAASSLDYNCKQELAKLLSSSAESSSDSQTPDPFVNAQPSSGSGDHNNDVADRSQGSQNSPQTGRVQEQPEQQRQRPSYYDNVPAAPSVSSRTRSASENDGATNTAGIQVSAHYSPARSSGSGSRTPPQQSPQQQASPASSSNYGSQEQSPQQQVPASPADALLRQISTQFSSPYGGFSYNNNDPYGATATYMDPATFLPQFSFGFGPAHGGGVVARLPSYTVGGLGRHAGNDEPAYPSSDDVFGNAPAGVDIVGTDTAGQLTFYGPQGNVLGNTNARGGGSNTGSNIQIAAQTPAPAIRYSPQNRRDGDASGYQRSSSPVQTARSSRSPSQSWPPPPPTVNLQQVYSPEPDRPITNTITSGFSSRTGGDSNPSAGPRRASSTTLLYSPLQSADGRQPGQISGSGGPASTGISIQNVDGRISGFVYGPQGVQRLGSNVASAQFDPAGNSYSYTTQQQQSSGSPHVSSASQSFQTINGEGVAVFNNNGNQRAYRVTTSGLQPLELSHASSSAAAQSSQRPQQAFSAQSPLQSDNTQSFSASELAAYSSLQPAVSQRPSSSSSRTAQQPNAGSQERGYPSPQPSQQQSGYSDQRSGQGSTSRSQPQRTNDVPASTSSVQSNRQQPQQPDYYNRRSTQDDVSDEQYRRQQPQQIDYSQRRSAQSSTSGDQSQSTNDMSASTSNVQSNRQQPQQPDYNRQRSTPDTSDDQYQRTNDEQYRRQQLQQPDYSQQRSAQGSGDQSRRTNDVPASTGGEQQRQQQQQPDYNRRNTPDYSGDQSHRTNDEHADGQQPDYNAQRGTQGSSSTDESQRTSDLSASTGNDQPNNRQQPQQPDYNRQRSNQDSATSGQSQRTNDGQYSSQQHQQQPDYSRQRGAQDPSSSSDQSDRTSNEQSSRQPPTQSSGRASSASSDNDSFRRRGFLGSALGGSK